MYEPGYELDENMKGRIFNWAKNLASVLETSQEGVTGAQSIDIDRSAAAPYFFMRLVNKGEERVVYALLVGKPIVVVCSKEMVKPFLSSMQSFQPRRVVFF